MIGFQDGAVTQYLSKTANTFEFENDDTYSCDKDGARSIIVLVFNVHRCTQITLFDGADQSYEHDFVCMNEMIKLQIYYAHYYWIVCSLVLHFKTMMNMIMIMMKLNCNRWQFNLT